MKDTGKSGILENGIFLEKKGTLKPNIEMSYKNHIEDSNAENIPKSSTGSANHVYCNLKIKDLGTPPDGFSKILVWKNCLVLSFSMMLLVTAHVSFESLQSTLNSEESLGTAGLTVLYATFACANLFLVVFTTSRVSHKRTLVVSMTTYLLYICTGFYSSWATVIPAAVFIGIGAAHMWVVSQTYMTALAKQHSMITESSTEDSNHLFFGIFTGFNAMRFVWGNLASSIVLHQDAINQTDIVESCGADFCPGDVVNNTRTHPPTEEQLFIYVGILLGFDVLAIALCALFLTDIRETHERNPKLTSTIRAVAMHIYRCRTQKWLVMISIYRGFQVGVMQGYVNMAFVGCPLGVGYIGWSVIAFGTTASLLSFVNGKIAKYTGLKLMFVIAFIAQGSAALAMLFWKLDPSKPEIVLMFYILWGIGESVFGPVVVAMYSTLYQNSSSNNAAYSTLRLLDSLGFAITFALASFLCIKPTIILTLVFMVISLILTLVLLLKKSM